MHLVSAAVHAEWRKSIHSQFKELLREPKVLRVRE
jgi:hypothetical protein